MRFEGEDSPERRFNGTIVGVEDISPQWESSRWRSLRVSSVRFLFRYVIAKRSRLINTLNFFVNNTRSSGMNLHLL